ncbi:MAG: hypothetical protein H6839_11375 [Planctomycetes bacterium]|nr:hypothetical protein [Planctomycetota bacterium]
MSTLPLLAANTTKPDSAAFELGTTILYGMLGILLVVLIVSWLVVREARKHTYVNPHILDALLFGSVGLPLLAMVATVLDWVPPSPVQPILFLVCAFTWVATLVGYTLISSRVKKEDEARDAERARELREGLGGADVAGEQAFTDNDIVEDEPVLEPAPTPRRAVTIPSGESDSARASEQALKRVNLAQLESAASEPKPPRASEIPENPLLPDEVVKIRCLACDKKMKAEGPKFARQRRCPNCKAEPFRYSIVA